MRRRSVARSVAVAVFTAALSGTPIRAAAVTSTTFAGGLASPVDIVHAGDDSGRLFIVEQGGTIRSLNGSALSATPYLDIAARVLAGGEQGLLGLAFHPQYVTNGRLFVDYTRRGDGATIIAEFRRSSTDPDRADPASERILLTIAQPFSNHNGGALRFGPDGLLYIGMGDGGSANDPGNRAQDPGELLGKILRIDVDGGVPYAIPSSNPFADGVAGRAEIWAVGVRNPWRFNFDRATGDLFVGDVGQDQVEEIDRFAAGTGAGANLGWRIMEGNRCTSLGGGVGCFDAMLTPPIIQYTHADGCSVTGGLVYRGTAVPALAGRYVYGDLCSGRIWSAARDATGAWVTRDILATGAAITAFGEDEQGELYYADYSGMQIRKIVAEPADRVDVVEYYHAGFDHYFITASPAEIAALDAAILKGWARTGYSFPARASPQIGMQQLCRFYIPPGQGDSHFFSASPAECDDVARKFPSFVVEGPTGIYMALPDIATGNCAPGALPVFRIWNRRADSNHRYTTELSIRNQMVAAGGIAEGYGPSAVALCAQP